MGPLSGLTVGVTADRRAGEQAALLGRLGARVVHGPTVRTIPLDHRDEGLARATAMLVADPPEVLVATTGVGMRSWFDAAEALGAYDALREALQTMEIVARGPKAAGAVAAAGLDVAWRAPSEQAEEVLAELLSRRPAPAGVAVQRDGDARALLADALVEGGVTALDVPTYRWVAPADLAPAGRLVDAALDGRLDAVTFTSSPAITNLLTMAERDGRLADLLDALNDGDLTVACVGPVCAATAKGAGIDAVVVPRRARLGAMVAALGNACSGRQRSLELAGRQAVLQGTRLILDGEELDLSERERAVVEVLAERPGAVVAKSELLARCWGPTTADPHVVEVTVARLRRRLGSPDSILTVRRRGYRLAT